MKGREFHLEPYVFTLMAFLTMQKPTMPTESPNFIGEVQANLGLHHSQVYTTRKEAPRISSRVLNYLVVLIIKTQR